MSTILRKTSKRRKSRDLDICRCDRVSSRPGNLVLLFSRGRRRGLVPLSYIPPGLQPAIISVSPPTYRAYTQKSLEIPVAVVQVASPSEKEIRTQY